MNLFLLSWNLPKESFSEVISELHEMTKIYPQLDPGTIWHWGRGNNLGTAFAASIHTSEHATAPRRYVWRTDDQVTFYDGCLVDRKGSLTAHDAESLSLHWNQLAESLEGQFIIARLTSKPLSIELLTDFLGIGQAYYLHRDNMWIISNSVNLILRVSKATTLDPLGVSLFLSTRVVGGDRTLRRDIRVIPGGQLWQWQQGTNGPNRQVYFPHSKLASPQRKVLTRQVSRELADELVGICNSLAISFGELQCGLTGGRDSRLLAALLISGEIPARFYTEGLPGCADVEIGTAIAQSFDLPHEITTFSVEDILENWETLSRRLIEWNDGMVNLWQITNVVLPAHIDRLTVKLWGVGGENARGFYFKPEHLFCHLGMEDIQELLIKKLVQDYGGLIRNEAKELVQDYLKQRVAQAFEKGFSSLDLLDYFFLTERTRRSIGSNARKAMPATDLFAPLLTRPFIEAVFAMPARYRYSEPLHFQLIRLLVRELLNIRLDKGHWRSQRPFSNFARWCIAEWPKQQVLCSIPRRFYPRRFSDRKITPNFDHSHLLLSKLQWLRELCLDQSDSMLWEFVDRSVFDSMTAPDFISDKPFSKSQLFGLYTVATLFSYFSS
jgi:asparagine synthase (glutamine-hydrolysing)